MLSELRKGSFLASKTGALAWYKANGRPPIVILTDPPYALVGSTVSTKRRGPKAAMGRPVEYGALTPIVRRGISELVGYAEWAMIYGMLCDMGNWRTSIERMGAAWCGVGIVKQNLGAPRIRGDAPGVRHLGLAVARRRRPAPRWKGRPWAEYSETRPSSVKDRPIPGTREVKVLTEMLGDMEISCTRPPVVVDPCAGTGTTLMAARALGLNAIGWERDLKTFEYAQRVIQGQGLSVDGQGDLQMKIEDLPGVG